MNSFTRLLRQNTSILFYATWFLLNLVQSAGTELLNDEAYYWVYSRFPDYGYFDHPPMIALLIRAGYAVFHNELGVRLFMAVMNTATVFLVQKMLLLKNDPLFYAIVLSMGVLQVGGILAVPDIPLAFFTALFFWQYRLYLEKPGAGQAILLGAVMALMLYSKYHGILIILFTFISNRKLALLPTAWLAVFTGMLLFAPHLWWQYVHDFPSVQYHLKERNAPIYKLAFTLEYIGGQVLLAGPLIGWLLLSGAWKKPASDLFSKALKYSLFGFYGFFLLSTLKGRVEANWTVPSLVPLIILAHAWLSDSVTGSRWVYRLLAPSMILVLLARVYAITDFTPLTSRFKDEFHHNRSWALAIKEKSGGLPAVFLNSYQKPSKYWFYTGDTSFGLNSTTYRRNNYNFWPVEKSLQHTPIFLVDELYAGQPGSIAIPNEKKWTAGIVHPYFESFSYLQLQPAIKNLEIKKGALTPFLFSADPDSLSLRLLRNSSSAKLVLEIFSGDEQLIQIKPLVTRTGKLWRCSYPDTIPLQPGIYRAKLGLVSSLPGVFSQNSISLVLMATD